MFGGGLSFRIFGRVLGDVRVVGLCSELGDFWILLFFFGFLYLVGGRENVERIV